MIVTLISINVFFKSMGFIYLDHLLHNNDVYVDHKSLGFEYNEFLLAITTQVVFSTFYVLMTIV